MLLKENRSKVSFVACSGLFLLIESAHYVYKKTVISKSAKQTSEGTTKKQGKRM